MPARGCAFKTFRPQFATIALFCACVILPAGRIAADPGLVDLAGSWQGNGTMSFESGQSEGVSCNGYYKGTGRFSIVIRCKGETSNFELRSKLNVNGDQVTGGWEERTYNAKGDASGTASAGKLNVEFSGSLTGSLEMTFSSAKQSISVSVGTKGAGIKGVLIDLSRK